MTIWVCGYLKNPIKSQYYKCIKQKTASDEPFYLYSLSTFCNPLSLSRCGLINSKIIVISFYRFALSASAVNLSLHILQSCSISLYDVKPPSVKDKVFYIFFIRFHLRKHAQYTQHDIICILHILFIDFGNSFTILLRVVRRLMVRDTQFTQAKVG